MRRGPTIAKPFTFGASRRQTVSFREPASPPLAERLAKADAAVPSRWRKEPAPRTKRRQTLTQPASPALATKNLRQKPLPPKKKEEVCTDFKARELDQRILGEAGGVWVFPSASRPCTARRRPAPRRARSPSPCRATSTNCQSRRSRPGSAPAAWRSLPRPFCVEPLPRWRRIYGWAPGPRHSFTRLAPTRSVDTPSTLLSRAWPYTPSARPATRLLTTQAVDGPRATTAAHETPAQNYVKALLGAPGAPAEVRGRQVEQAPHGSTDATHARTSKAPASDAALRTEET